MPKTRTKKRRRRRRTTKMQIVRQIGNAPVSKTQITKLKYVTRKGLDPGIGGLIYSTFNAGSCYDPDTDAIGHQPTGFDQWMAFYEHFVVLGSKIKVTFSPTGLQPQDGIAVCGIMLNANPTDPSPSAFDQVLEYRNTKHKTMGAVPGYSKGVSVSHRYSAKRFLGRQSVLSDPDLKGDINANPTESAYYQVFVSPVNSGYNLGVVNALVEIEYIVAFIEPRLLPSS